MKNVVLLFGGISDERLVSVASAQNVATLLPGAELWFESADGAVARAELSELTSHQRPFEVPFKPAAKPFAHSVEESLASLNGRAIFIGLHGTEGEDGSLQALFEKRKIPFTGSGSDASRVCFDKAIAKKRMADAGLKVPAGFAFRRDDKDASTRLLNAVKEHGRIVVKPTASGSSFGLNFLFSESDCQSFLKGLPASPYEEYLAEQFLVGREMTVGVLERTHGPMMPLPPSEVVMQAGRNFDYQGKYLGKGSTEITPADLNQAEREACQRLALDAHKTLGCAGYSRTDMILTSQGPVFLETNTLPGLTRASFIPQQLQAAQIPMTAFIADQMEFAQARYR